ncbi:hypothetical protein [Halalkalibacter akibai]|uniref:Uncharacterized protein n=1 Tax=Halalkalibacter akibai (strain ATCC 43226 / DSM 21942 / CIP 109018 / JCM 9157 / 1139) TaxID=1236973 RepID=W4QYT6_HALA3|nr:hypothetical protein [Halalkalibacter akibai]GAE36444.1 hypothetical protein JCM9157_3630 [Halalkalibacter akibai JCM 9157]
MGKLKNVLKQTGAIAQEAVAALVPLTEVYVANGMVVMVPKPISCGLTIFLHPLIYTD